MTDDPTPSATGTARPAPIDTTRTHSARIWNYWMGGKDNYPIDREAGDQVAASFPEIVDLARTSREFLVRVVTHLAGEAGIRQFLDIGTGMPTAGNTHEVAQEIAPESRVVYVDNDPLVLAHARALLVGSPEGVTDYIDADLRDPAAGRGDAGLRPAHRAHAHGRPRPHPRRRGPADRAPARGRPALGQLPGDL
jgi:hypothetical protein